MTPDTPQELARWHAEQAERLVEESAKHKMQSARGHLAAQQAGAHASLAVYYATIAER
jgi:hypothetical protein